MHSKPVSSLSHYILKLTYATSWYRPWNNNLWQLNTLQNELLKVTWEANRKMKLGSEINGLYLQQAGSRTTFYFIVTSISISLLPTTANVSFRDTNERTSASDCISSSADVGNVFVIKPDLHSAFLRHPNLCFTMARLLHEVICCSVTGGNTREPQRSGQSAGNHLCGW